MQLSEIYERHQHVGYRITCRRHWNHGDHTECKKDITMGTGTINERLDPEECIRRLKRWFIGGANGFNENRWPDAEKRSCHLRYGEARLWQLASGEQELNPLYGVGDDQLDELCTAVAM